MTLSEWIRILIEAAGLGIVIYNQVQASKKVEAIHAATNSMKDALVAATESEALARGHAAGLAEARDR